MLRYVWLVIQHVSPSSQSSHPVEDFNAYRFRCDNSLEELQRREEPGESEVSKEDGSKGEGSEADIA